MAYPIEKRIASKNGWFTPAQARAYYGRYSRVGITVHWWGDGTGANNHDNIVNYFLAKAAQGVKSVNYVVSDRKITKVVEPSNVAWASQAGNPTTISIEFQPTLNAEGYKRGGDLIYRLEKKYGKPLGLYKHSHWFATACPGSISLSRLRSEADKARKLATAPASKPKPTKGVEVKTTRKLLDQAYQRALGRKRKGKEGENVYLGKPLGQVYIWLYESAEATKRRANESKALANYKKTIADLRASLSKKPKETVKVVEKIVDKTSDVAKDTNTKVSAIFDYFSARWQTFRNFLKRDK